MTTPTPSRVGGNEQSASEDPSATPQPQSLVIVSASTGQYDSRGQRYARSAAERGHTVTILARRSAGLPRDEQDPSGYRTVRLAILAIDGVPLGRRLRKRFPVLGRFGRSGATLAPAEIVGTGSGGLRAARRRTRVRRSIDWLVARLRIPLTIRAQTSAALATAPPADVYLAMGLWALPAALALGRRHRARVIYDVAEIHMEARTLARVRGPIRPLIARAERRWARRADALITVNDALADLLASRLGAGRPEILLNTPPRYPLRAETGHRFHAAAALPVDARVVLYHGGLFEERGVEQLMEAIGDVRNAVLVLMGYESLVPTIQLRIAEQALDRRAVLLPPVPPIELPDWVASADVVAVPIQPTTLNHRYATPNKLWEAMSAGVPILASDLPGMAGIIRETNGGVLVDPTDPAAIARGLRELLGQSAEARQAMHDRLVAAARDRYCWEVEEQTYLGLLSRLTGRPW